ncbi:MAG: hypothetical protein ACFFCZ_21315 [Promethearchaeota archaeon]
MVRLSFKETEFVEGNLGDATAHLDLDEKTGSAVLIFAPNAGIVVKRMAGRQARGICKTGIRLKNGKLMGVGYNLDIQEGNPINDVLLQEGYRYKGTN